MAYDATGNITQKIDTTGTKNYTYHATKKHAVITAGATSYTYDNNGNMQTRGGVTQTWDAANFPTVLTNGTYSATFNYGPSRARYKQVATYSGRTETTTYIGSLYEKFTKTTSTDTEHRYLVTAGGLPVAKVTDVQPASGSVTRTTTYLHRDHLGSVDTITDEAGAVLTRMSFDAHGNRRAAMTSQGTAWQARLTYASNAATVDGFRAQHNRGFTDHEMLDNVGLVHMNGRVYDPVIGRFMSVDPVFQFPENTQSLNPYTYVLNTPLSATDPTGYMSLGGFLQQGRAAAETAMMWRKHKNGAMMFARIVQEFVNGADAIGEIAEVADNLMADFQSRDIQELSADVQAGGGGVFALNMEVSTRYTAGRAMRDNPDLVAQMTSVDSTTAMAECGACTQMNARDRRLIGNKISREQYLEEGNTQAAIGAVVGAPVLLAAIAASSPLGAVFVAGVDFAMMPAALEEGVPPVLSRMNPRALLPRQGRSEMSSGKVKRLTKRIRSNGYDESQPIDVAKIGEKNIILDGHHRARAASNIGISDVPVRLTSVSGAEADILLRQVDDAILDR